MPASEIAIGRLAAEDVGERVDLDLGDGLAGLVDDDAGDRAFDVEDELEIFLRGDGGEVDRRDRARGDVGLGARLELARARGP